MRGRARAQLRRQAAIAGAAVAMVAGVATARAGEIPRDTTTPPTVPTPPPQEPAPIAPDAPVRTGPPTSGPGTLRPSWDLDDWYVWLGPLGAATRVNGAWDSLFGGDLAVLRVRERQALSAIGGDFGASRYSEHDGGRLWLDAVAGTRLAGRAMAGVTAGAVVDIASLEHPRVGAAVGAWAFVGATPYAKVGVMSDGGGVFVELGLRISLPVWRQ